MTATTQPRWRPAALALAGAIVLCSAQAHAQEISLKAGTSWNDKFPMAEMLNGVLKPKLAEYSGGRLGMEVHLAGSLCNEKTCVEQVKLGQTDIGTASVSNYGGFHKTYEILTLPYIFTSDAAAQSVLDGFLFETLGRISVKQDKMKVLAVVPLLGFRQLETNVGTVRTPADLRGVKIRVTKSPLDGALIRAWGAVATPIAWAETYDAVQQKVVRGLYIQKPVHAMMKFYEVAPNVTLTGGAWTPMIIFMSLDRYNQLPGWAREALDKAAADLRAQTFAIDAKYAAKMGSANIDKIDYYQPTPEEMTRWHKAAAQAWLVGKKLKLYDPALARRVLEAQDGTEALLRQLATIGAL